MKKRIIIGAIGAIGAVLVAIGLMGCKTFSLGLLDIQWGTNQIHIENAEGQGITVTNEP